ncbi:MAG TPA: DUF362 domain-containing protein [Patescibacteria group bacterium]|nr:DUF362 domain-containing protein [Patescibacteria group bacterium]
MKSKVYFIEVKDASDIWTVNNRLNKLLQESKVLDFIRKDSNIAIKLHFGEAGNGNFVRPEHVRVVCDGVVSRGAKPVLSDANTLYRGRRLNSQDHLQLAYEHGFTKTATGADVVIPDDNQKDQITDVEINQKAIKKAKLARLFIDADGLVAVSHFKGHILTGFGGTLKNIGMGCATREGKLAQHCDVSPVVYVDRCTGCAECSIVCPVKAITIKNKKSVVDSKKCIGCASCLAACPTMAMFIDFGATDQVQQKVAEYSLAVLKDKKGKAGFLNFAVKISRECDCWNLENPRIGPDVGILASSDPVSIDKASLDMVARDCKKDIFKAAHPDKDGVKQLMYAQEIGLGSLDYELVEVRA